MKRSLLLVFVLFGFPWFLCSQTISWKQLDGPHLGNIHAIVADEVGNLYLNATNGWDNLGPYKSTDGGANWASISNGIPSSMQSGKYNPMSISSDGSLFLARINDNVLPYISYVYRSTDGGNNWAISSGSIPFGDVFCISNDQTGNIYLGTDLGVFKSSDNGNNWAEYGYWLLDVKDMAFNDKGHVFITDSYGVYRSIDDGASWKELLTGKGIETLAIKNDSTLFAGGAQPGGILRSTDNGDSWEYVYPQTVTILQGSTVLIDTNGDIYFPTNGNGVLKSTDNGDNWTEVNNGLGDKYISVVAKSMNGDFLAGGNSAIYRSTDGCASWYSVGLNTFHIKTIAINQNNDIFTTLNEEEGILLSTDGGNSWQMSPKPPYTVLSLAINESTGSIFAGCKEWVEDSGLLFKSTDNGNSWSRSDNGFLHDEYGSLINAIAVNSSGHIFAFGIVAGHTFGLVSTDDGENWTVITSIGHPDGKITALAVNSTGDLFVATQDKGIWRLIQGETNWINVTRNNSNSIYVGSNDYIYASKKRSTDNGETWTAMTIAGSSISSFAENSLGHLFCGSKNGVFRSTDYGDTWEQINNGLAILDIRSLAMDSDDYLYAGTWGHSVFRTATSTTNGIDVIPSVSDVVKVFPNPAKETLWLAGTDKLDGNKEINIYDVNGRMLIQKHFPALMEVLELDVSALKSGIYFCQITTKDLSITKKIIIKS